MNLKFLPQWTFDDTYVDFDNEKFINALKDTNNLIDNICDVMNSDFQILKLAKLYEECFDKISSLQAFCRCKLSENTKNEQVAPVQMQIQKYSSKLELAKEALLKKLSKLNEDDELWQKKELSGWKFLCKLHKNGWQKNLNTKQQEFYASIEQSNFAPLYNVFTHLNNLVNIQAKDKDEKINFYNLSKCAGILKGSADKELRKNVFNALEKHYNKYAFLYVDILNMLHGFRLNKFKEAGINYKIPSYEQNRISPEAISAMYKALEEKVSDIRQTVLLRAKYLSSDKMSSCDLLAPSPYSCQDFIPYDKAINTICQALSHIGSEIPNFINLMLEKRWIEAQVRDNKTAGAFYTRFNDYKQPRVFSSYMGTQAHMIQQAHELGHAWHYWIMRDMSTLQTEFPMTLAEIASTFNEAVLRNYIKKSGNNENLLFNILWQELKSAANFMLHISVRYDFEISMIETRSKQILTPQDIRDLLARAWQKWYGDSTEDMELFLPYFKLHFYKTDQYIYNYPYTVGYLISQFLIDKFKHEGENFINIYKAFLRDSGQMSVDDILQKHFNKNIKSVGFWLDCIDSALVYVDEFKALKK